MKKLAFIFMAMLLASVAVAQKTMTIEDAVVNRYRSLYPRMLSYVQWQDDKHFVSYADKTIWQHQLGEDNKTALLDSAMIAVACEAIGQPYTPFVPAGFVGANTIVLKGAKAITQYNLDTDNFDSWIDMPQGAEVPDYSLAGNRIVYAKGQNLFVTDGETEEQITHETEPGILCGRYVSRREFGITKGTFWSPTGRYLAFYRKDESRVRDYPLTDFMTRQAENKPIKYPMAGMDSEQVSLGIYDTQSGKTIYLNTGKADEHYLTNISWGPKEEYIYMAELNREQNHMQMNQYAVSSGNKVKCLFEEQNDTYVEPQFPIVFSQKKSNEFFYRSRRDGFFHLYRYNTDGELLGQVTKGDWEVTDFYGCDPSEKYAYIQATKNSALDRNIYQVKLSNGDIKQLDAGDGVHKATFSPKFSHFVDSWSAPEVPGVMEMRKSNGKLLANIFTATNTLADYELGETKVFKIKAADGKTDLYARLTLPNDFDPNKKYPAIVYVYGGPHAQLITNSWHYANRWWAYYMASEGYVMLTVDNRGSANRGQAFEDVIHRQLGIEETKDQMQGIKYLKEQGFVDMDRIGVHGWSYGGFMTTNLMLRQPETFKVGVAGGPVVDWKMYEIMYGERYMDSPQENPDGYAESNMINHVGNLQGKLLYIHGEQDDTVVLQHSMKFLRECITQDKQVDFFVYPTHPHNVSGTDRAHLMTKVSQYFFDYL